MSWQARRDATAEVGGCAHTVAVGVYLLGSLSAEEAVEFAEHLAGCGECQAEVDELAPVVRALDTLRDR